ncbi:MAG TPA: HNH endonuclease, partial [Nevskia sp.]|nr:HNH endonuclease [Nevskia sp.]
MPTKPIDRLLFVQGGHCFFCKRALDKADASVEHLLAASRGGPNSDENCVACCKSVNALFGSM